MICSKSSTRVRNQLAQKGKAFARYPSPAPLCWLQFAKDVKQGKGGEGIFLDPWWLFGPGHEVTANKRLWDLGAELVDNIPHSNEVSSRHQPQRTIDHFHF